ncbi:tRNA (uracil-5-)-methyltransferase [Tremella mesenterica]|uniref:tRNA (Uracil-5-)-methyltransferase n=1 Tax=Tremella mesenterica TaxID=5217 RepID=A0A4V1M307_TREME|nr:tRNA (uracil-5-)-methyltransferase [Tremella mesenterica]
MSASASPPSTPPPKRLKLDESLPTNGMILLESSIIPVGTSSKTIQFQQQKKKKRRRPLPEPYSPADVLFRDICDFLGPDYCQVILESRSEEEWVPPSGLEIQRILELRVGAFTVSGESLSLYEEDGKKWAVVVPFAHPGDLIRARIYKHDRFCSFGGLVDIIEYSEDYRGGEGDRRKYPENGCRYFGECGGCQLQPIPYPLQLLHKRRTVQLAYQRFSGLPFEQVPIIRETIGSPKQWGYRTKITPHFDAPPKSLQRMNAPIVVEEKRKKWECRIGFERKGRPGVMDIEECPIATPVLNEKLKEERARIEQTILTFKKGATLLLRDSLPPPSPIPGIGNPYRHITDEETHLAVTNHRQPVFERVGNYLFSFTAGSFFQNNNSILVPLTEHVQEAIFPSSLPPSDSPQDTTATITDDSASAPQPTHLVDTYCGSGLFGITLSSRFEKVAGVEINNDSIVAARKNAEMNGLEGKTTWLCGKAEDIFAGLPQEGFKGENSCVVVDPPRKGCDEPFLRQLLAFAPVTIVYVSCNVHTQARDVGWFLREAEKGEHQYVLESVRGFDLFPQVS